MLTKSKYQSVSFELEGTNSAGDLGAAIRIISEPEYVQGFRDFYDKATGAYEAVSGLQGGYNHEDYTELGAEATINFPRFLFPFLSNDFRRKIRATTEFGVQYNYQIRPSFHASLLSANWVINGDCNVSVLSIALICWISTTCICLPFRRSSATNI